MTSFIKTNKATADIPGVITATLSILVTVLIGYQIFNVITFEDKLKIMKEDYDKALKNAIGQLRNENSCDISINTSVYFYEREMYQESLSCLVNAMKAAISIDNPGYVSTISVNLKAVVNTAKKKDVPLTLLDEEKKVLQKGIINYSSSILVKNVGNVNVNTDELLKLMEYIEISKGNSDI